MNADIKAGLLEMQVCIFAYGQTGSGKTYTMRGAEGAPGILPQAAADMFTGVGDRIALTLRMSVLELYQDNLVDLLVEPGSGGKLNIRVDEKVPLCFHKPEWLK
jgi:hypothetical protein